MNPKLPTILVVDDTPANLSLLFDILDLAGFEVLVSPNGESALKRAENTYPDIILLDVMMPGIDGFETCRRLKAQALTQNIPVIFMTALSETVNKVAGFALGAVDYITKPLEPEEVLARVRIHLTIQHLQNELQAKNALLADREVHLMHLVEAQTQKIENITLTLVQVLEHAMLLSDDETGKHVKRIGVYAAFLAEKYGCDREFVRRIKLYAPLHDIGKVGLPDALLKKAGKYTPDEILHMQQHVVFGARLLAGDEIDGMAQQIAQYHHEKWNGTGYVARLAGPAIPLEARLVALADVYDALINKRVYKDAFPEDHVEQIIRTEAGNHFEPQLVELFFTHLPTIREIRQSLT